MPPESSQTNERPSAPRRRQRALTEEELKDIQEKRLKGELSCAECRRLKLRCNKGLPCSSCVRRGCESICPCGVLSAGQGTRFILAGSERLHGKITDMSTRIRKLEEALAAVQPMVSDERHPLLEEHLLQIKFGAEKLTSDEDSEQQHSPSAEPLQDSIDVLGTLTLDDEHGEAKFFGSSAGSETLMMVAGDEWSEADAGDLDGDATFSSQGNVFPFALLQPGLLSISQLQAQLPDIQRAHVLCQSWVEHGTLFFRPITKEELFEDILFKAYKLHPGSDAPALSAHALASLFFIMALGSLFDRNSPAFNAQADSLYDLGRTCLSLRPIMESPQFDTVRAVGLLATYSSMAGKRYSREIAWSGMSLAAKLAQSIGLHRDSARWNMEAKRVQKRRLLWWEIFSADVSHSLALGRPPAVHPAFVDCEFPTDEEATLDNEGSVVNGFWRVKHLFARDIFWKVALVTLTAKPSSYSTVLELDSKIREVNILDGVPTHARLEDGAERFYSSALALRDFYAGQYKSVSMLYLHRSFFAQALLDHPHKPLSSPFAPSVSTAYHSASMILRAGAHMFDRSADLAMRAWFFLYHIFSAAIVAGTIVIRSPSLKFASNALEDLEIALRILERGASQSTRARTALTILKKLHSRARQSYDQHHAVETRGETIPRASETQTKAPDDLNVELSMFGGQARVLTRSKTAPRNKTRASASPNGSVMSDPASNSSLSNAFPDISHENNFLQGNSSNDQRLRNPRSYYPNASMPQELGPSHSFDIFDTFNQFSQSHGVFTQGPQPQPQPHPDFSMGASGHTPQFLPQPGSGMQYPSSNIISQPLMPPLDGSTRSSLSPTAELDYQTLHQDINSLSNQLFSNSTLLGTTLTTNPINSISTNVASGADGVLELGLDSGMDAGWLSFMRECGIVPRDTSANGS